jgi:serine/threonine protein kinase
MHCQNCLPGFVHGDIKPENLLIGVGHILKITDFGLSRAAKFRGVPIGSQLGTPMYLAPELWTGKEPSEKSDIYAVGSVIYEMLAGKQPFGDCISTPEVRDAHLHRPVNVLPSGVPNHLANVVYRCLSKNPDERPTVKELCCELGEQLPDLTIRDGLLTATQLNNLGTKLAAIGNHEQAVKHYRKALDLAPGDNTILNNYAISCSKLGMIEEAETAYRLLLASGRDGWCPANYAAHILRTQQKDRYAEGLAYCDQALSLSPRHVSALVTKAALLNSLGRFAQAAKAGEEARRIDSAVPEIWFELATAYWRLGKRNKASTCVDKALKRNPDFEEAKILRSLIHARRS